MASHRQPRTAGRARIATLTVTAAASVALSSQVSFAEPEPSVSEVKAKVDRLNGEAEQAAEKYNGAREQQRAMQAQVGDLRDGLAREQARMNDLRDGLGAAAAAQYRSGGIDPSVQLFLSGDPDDYLERASLLNQAGTRQANVIEQLQERGRVLGQQRALVSDKLTELQDVREELKERKEAVQAKLAEAQKLLNTLTEQQRASLAGQDRAGRDTQRPPLSAGQAGSQRAAAALAAAEGVLGVPYVWGASGPSSFDCSGLTQWAYAAGGVSLPRTTYDQANAGTRLTMNRLAPGDLVFFFGDLHHVGLYAGGGKVLHAPRTGTVVRYESMSTIGPFQFGVRV